MAQVSGFFPANLFGPFFGLRLPGMAIDALNLRSSPKHKLASQKQRRRRISLLLLTASAVCLLLCSLLGETLHHAGAALLAFTLPSSPLTWRPKLQHCKMLGSTAGGSCKGQDLSMRQAKGFASPSTSSKVPAPEGGWPTLSVLVLGSERKQAKQGTLKHLGLQNYPVESIQEIVVSGTEILENELPKDMKPLLTELRHSPDDALDLQAEIASCTGDYVVVWGDDHVSPADRLRSQVSQAIKEKTSTVLQANWFFDSADKSFLKVNKWPVEKVTQALSAEEAEAFAGFKQKAELMVVARPLTLCGAKEALIAASEALEPSPLPVTSLQELLFKLDQPPKIISDMQWAVSAAPPVEAQYQAATPAGELVRLAQTQFPKGKDVKSDVLKRVEKASTAAMAVEELLSEGSTKPLSTFALSKIRDTVAGRLAKGTGEDTLDALQALASWHGLKPGQGDAKAAAHFPMFWAAFSAVRSHINDNADTFNIMSHGALAEGLVRLASAMWGTDDKVINALYTALIQEQRILYEGNEKDMPDDKGLATSDIVGTLGLRDALEAIGFAVVHLPEGKYPVQALVSIAWAFGEAGIDRTALQSKVARGVMSNSDKLTPPDMGKLWNAMHENKWFKDVNIVGYLTETMLAQAKRLKENDPGLAQAIAPTT